MKIAAVNGSLRLGSSNAALLRAAARLVPPEVEVVFYDGLDRLPHFNPDLDAEDRQPPEPVAELRALLTGCGGVLISSPEYAHGVPGALKNMLDWLVSTGELARKPVALLNASPTGGTYAQASLLETLRTMNWRVVEEASLTEPFVSRRITGELTEEAALDRLRVALEAFVRAIA
ncbi:MAG TPA: NAD(P)H-dependent oxidoreductase [Thermoanaerobaculia bacterium]|jgi:NAD(P)H-dependent FMN reductase